MTSSRLINLKPLNSLSLIQSKTDNGKFKVDGTLTIKDISHPVSFIATIEVFTDYLHSLGEIVIDRTLYNIRYGSGKFIDNLGDKLIYDDFVLQFKLVGQAYKVNEKAKCGESNCFSRCFKHFAFIFYQSININSKKKCGIKQNLLNLLGIEYPIVQGPFGGGLSSVNLTSTVSNAGGLGSFGGQPFSSKEIIETCNEIKKITDKPFNINLMGK